MQLRLQTLRKAKEQLEKDEKKRRDPHKSRSRRSQVVDTTDSLPVAPLAQLELDDLQSNVSDECEPYRVTSTPINKSQRRRSFAGNSIYSTSAPVEPAFMSSLQYADDNYFQDMITDDMSDRVVASFPAEVAANSRLRASRESLNNSLHGSKESLRSRSSSRESLNKFGSTSSLDRLRRSMDNILASRHSLRCSRESLSLSLESLTRRKKSSSLPRDTAPTPSAAPAEAAAASAESSTINKHNRPRRKMFKRSNTAMAAFDRNGLTNTNTDTNKPRWSLNTGSTESLPRYG